MLPEPTIEATGHDRWLRVASAAELLGLSASTLRRWSDAGRLPHYRTAGGQRRYRRRDLERLLHEATATPALGYDAAPVADRPLSPLESVETARILTVSQPPDWRLFEALPDAVLVIDADSHTIVWANMAAARLFGAAPDAVAGRSCHGFVCPAERGRCPVSDLGQTIDHSQCEFLAADGHLLPVLKSVSQVTTGSGTYLVESIQERSQRLTSLLDASRAISSSLVVDEVLDTVVRRAAETLRADISLLFAYDAASDTITPRAMFEREPTPYDDMGKPRPLSEYPQGRAILEGGEVRLECISDPQLDPQSRASMEQWNEKSCLSVPLSFRAEPMGMLLITDTVAERRYSAEELELVKALGEQAAVALHNAELYRDQARRTQRLTSMLEAGKAITSSLVLDEVLATVAHRAASALDCPECIIYDYDADEDTLVARALYQHTPTPYTSLGEPMPLSEWPSDRQLLEGHKVVAETLSDQTLDPEIRASMESWGEKTCLNVPLYFGGQALGLLVLIETQRERDYTADDIELAAGLGEQAAIAIHNARLVEHLRLRTDEATLLNDVARAASTSLSVTDIAAAIIEPLRRRIPFDRATLLLRRPGSAVFDVAFSTEAESQLSGISSTDLETSFLAHLKTSSVALLSLSEQSPLAAGHPITGLLCGVVVGIREDEELIGALVLGSESEAAYSKGDLAVLDGIAAQLSLAVCNARLYENVETHAPGQRAGSQRRPHREGQLHHRSHGTSGLLRGPAGERARVVARGHGGA